jgi:tRNASer (uridine44-2'-O)-methyltransferase
MDTGSPDDRLLPHNLAAWGSQDIAIAAFLMLLWKDMYPAREGSETGMEWDRWGRPPGGFVDLGCGNGLLVHVLVSEVSQVYACVDAQGYAGRGYELRERRTWPQYPEATRAALVELPIDMPSWFPSTIDEWESGTWPGKEACAVKDGVFLIGNHSDELTVSQRHPFCTNTQPWIPLLSLIPRTPVPHLSLPCCLHTLDGKWTKTVFNPPAHAHSPAGGFDDGLEPGASRYKAYTMWLGYNGLLAGWQWEKENLRIPSTRGWAIVARRRWTDAEGDRAAREWALSEVNGVRTCGAFAVRVKEGKDH